MPIHESCPIYPYFVLNVLRMGLNSLVVMDWTLYLTYAERIECTKCHNHLKRTWKSVA